MNITGGTARTSFGGNVSITSGLSKSTSSGNIVVNTPDAAPKTGPDTGGVSGAMTFDTGDSTDGYSGAFNVTTGDAIDGGAGDISFIIGDNGYTQSVGLFHGGKWKAEAGSNVQTGMAGGAIDIDAGQGGSYGGTVYINAGNGLDTAGGYVRIQAGNTTAAYANA